MKEQDILPKDALELFSDYNPKDLNSARKISGRVEKFRKKHEGETHWFIVSKRDFAKPCINHHPHYSEIMNQVNENTTFLDAGCGIGWDARRVIKDALKKENVKGIDIDPNLIEMGLKLYGDKEVMKGVFEVRDALSTGYEDGSFDIVTSNAVIQILREKELITKYVKEVYRILKKPDGIFFGRTLGDDTEWKNEHLYVFSVENLKKYLTAFGFRNVDVQPVGRIKRHPSDPRYNLQFYTKT